MSALQRNINDRENDKFFENFQGETTVRVGDYVQASWDYLSVAYPTSTQEVYTFKSGGSGGTTIATVVVDYTDSTKDFISTVART